MVAEHWHNDGKQELGFIAHAHARWAAIGTKAVCVNNQTGRRNDHGQNTRATPSGTT